MNVTDMNINGQVAVYERQIVSFARKLLRMPSYTGDEGRLAGCIVKEMKRCGWKKVYIDDMGNVIGRVGAGKKKILIDAHMDTVDAGDLDTWAHKPFGAEMTGGRLFGRGAVDQKSAIASVIYAGKVMNDLKLCRDSTVYFTASVQEEGCEGVALYNIIRNEGIRPDYVFLSEPSNLKLIRGQRGRMEIEVITRGRTCHGSMPDLGVNAVELMSPIVLEVSELNARLRKDSVFGKGSVAVTKIESFPPSHNVIPDKCVITLDRRLVPGESAESALNEVKGLSYVRRFEAGVNVGEYNSRSWTGKAIKHSKYYPAWLMPEEHDIIKSSRDAFRSVFEEDPRLDVWQFSTNGVTTAGKLNIPTMGFGPGDPKLAHTSEEFVITGDLLKCAAFYAAVPRFL